MKTSLLLSLVLIIIASSCSGSLKLPADVVALETLTENEMFMTVVATSTATVAPSAKPTLHFTLTTTPVPSTPTITSTPIPLNIFTSTDLRPWVTPVSYLEDTCNYLENRWGEGKSEPGTIVVPIMFHSVAKPGREITDTTTISMAYFEAFMAKAKEMGFSTITTDELVGFLEHNEKIPERSMILILDDQRPGVTELFMPYLEENDWTLTLGWITTEKTRESVWLQMETLAESGRLDIQSHGHYHRYIEDYFPREDVELEIYKPIEVIQDHFGTTPSAIVWPGGNFTTLSLQLAREAGFKLGFTAFSRGPIMFNWIPQGDPEIAMDDPLLLLPRYWSTAADVALEHGVAIGAAVKEDAEAVKTVELIYYSQYCISSDDE